MATWTLAANLQHRVTAIKARWPGIVVGTIGDQSHQGEQSDHNPDNCGVVHAIDPMTGDHKDWGNEIVRWLLSAPADLEYIIFDGQIWERLNDWKPVKYDGADQHETHVHASGKHGASCWSIHTGVAYDKNAEKIVPAGLPGPVPPFSPGETDVSAFILKGFTGTPTTADGRHHISDNSAAGFHVMESQAYRFKAFPGAVTINASDCPAGWDYKKITQQLFGPGAPDMTLSDDTISEIAKEVALQVPEMQQDDIETAVRSALTGAFITPAVDDRHS